MSTAGETVSQADILQRLVATTVDRWGAERAVELQPTLERTAEALWLVLRWQLEPVAQGPDFLGPPTW